MTYLTTKLGESPVIVEGIYNVSAASAFEAWTNPNEITEWFGASPNSMERAEIDLTLGGTYRFIFEETKEKTIALEGEYLEIIPNEKLVFSWRHVVSSHGGQQTATEDSRVTLIFAETDGKTKITLNHENINTKDGLLGVGNGWQATFESFNNIIAINN